MSRRKSREQAFALIFESSFHDDKPAEELIADATEARDLEVDAFALSLATGVREHSEELDGLIAAHSHKWSTDRLSRVVLSILRLAVYEMLHTEETPDEVAISEAVELSKKYGGDDDSAFVNGVLGGIARREQ